MFNSIQTKIAVPVIGILLALVLFIVIYASYSVQNFADELSEERLQGAARTAQAYIEQLERYNRVSSRTISTREDIVRLVHEWNSGNREYTRQALLERLIVAKDELAEAQFMVTDFVITDITGVVILRTTDPGNFGDSGLVSPIISAAYEGRVETVYTVTERMPLGLSSSAPIIYNNEIIGTVSTIMNLGTPAFVEEFGEVFNAEVTVFAGSTSLASTLYLDRSAGIRAIGTNAQPRVVETVLERGVPFDDKINLFGEMYHAFYFPLFGWEETPVGMFFLGFSIEDAVIGTDTFIRNLILLGFAGLAIAAAVMLLGINLNANKVSRLSKIVENITNGGAYSELENVRVSNDEVGALSSNVITLVETIRKLSADRSITEIKNHIEEIEQTAVEAAAANKAKSEFLSRMSHEIRTPMGAILGITEIQLRNKEHPDETKEAFEKIYASGEMLLGIINDILDLSKIEADKMELIVDRYDVASMISDTSQLNMQLTEDKPIRFDVSVNEEIPSYLYGDELRIKQILNNILSNAFKYTTAGAVKMSVGKVSYSSETVTLVFTISDTGQGMTQAQVNSIFEEFTRFNHVVNREIEGAGLGMSIVQTLLHKMNGKISVDSEPGMGSIFTVRIPQKIADKRVLGKETAENLGKFKYFEHKKVVQANWEPMPYGKILVVDDTSLNIYVAKGLLTPYEVQVDSADSGFAAIEKVKSGMTYDLIFLDHMMPQMDGIETVRRLRQMGYTAPIVAFTANALVGQEENFIEKGFDDFISKPIQSAHLNSILNKYVRDNQEQMKEKRVLNISKTQIDHDELCKEFAKSQKNVILQMKRATKAHDYKTAQLLAHTLRSLAGLIGETKLMNLSGKAESSFRKERLPIDILNNLSVEVERVLTSINKKINNESKLPPPSKEKQKEIFETLEALLSQNNAEVINLLSTLEAIPKTEEIITNIENYNFALALESLEKFKKEN